MLIKAPTKCLFYKSLDCDKSSIFVEDAKNGGVTCAERNCQRFCRYWREKQSQRKNR